MSRVDMIFDGDCVLCSGAVRFILRHERAPIARFVDAWSPTGLALAAEYGFSAEDLDETFLVVTDEGVFTKSDAVIVAAGWLRPPWRWLRAVRVLPRTWRDAVYAMIARRRYRWFGRRDVCFAPPPHMRQRFITR